MLSNNELECIEQFAGDRSLNNNVKQIIYAHQENIKGNIFRGLPFPKHLIKKGTIIEEWHESSHWTTNKEIAIKFSKDYINEDYSEELQKQLNLSEEEIFVPVILLLENPKHVFSLYKYLNKKSCFIKEKEILIVGYDFIIKDFYYDNIYQRYEITVFMKKI